MKMEIHSVSGKAAKDSYNAKMTSFNTRVAAAKKALLFSGSASAASASGVGNSAQARQQTQEEKQAASLEVLKKARQQLAETEAVGVNTVNELAKQQDQIKKSRDNMEEVNSNLHHSNKLLNKMSQWWRG
jgi:methylthioribose-1-phosphate isomerase